jgi:hypothetical protein
VAWGQGAATSQGGPMRAASGQRKLGTGPTQHRESSRCGRRPLVVGLVDQITQVRVLDPYFHH